MVNLLPCFTVPWNSKTKAKPLKGRPPVTGRLIKLCRYWMSLKSGKGDALRKEKGVFAYFCRRMDKSKASGGTRPADFAFKNINNKGNRLTICCPLYHDLWLKTLSAARGARN